MSASIDLELDVSVEGVEPLLDDEEAEAVCAAVLRCEGVERPCMASLSWVGDGQMQELNAEWRDVDAPTDVLSLECERPDDPDLAPGEACELGDIVLAPAYIVAQAARFGTTPADEARLLLVHGMLHLLGYDHLTIPEAEAMEAVEERILSDVPTDAPLGHVVLTLHREEDAQ